MTELEKITTVKPSSSFVLPVSDPKAKFAELEKTLREVLEITPDEYAKFQEGIKMEKNKHSSIQKIFLDATLNIIESGKPEPDNSKQYTLYIQNKKITKDLALNFFNVLKNFDQADRGMKFLILGTLISSLIDI